MGPIMSAGVPCAKGWVCYCLEQCSRLERARDYLQGLKKAIEQIAPSYQGLEQVFDEHLIARVVVGEGALEKRRKIREHLKANWYDAASPETYFPEEQVARIVAEGLLKTLEASLAAKAPLPITSWWLPDYPDVKTLTMLDRDSVTLLILTPRPLPTAQSRPAPMRDVILGDAEAWDGLQSVREIGTDVPNRQGGTGRVA